MMDIAEVVTKVVSTDFALADWRVEPLGSTMVAQTVVLLVSLLVVLRVDWMVVWMENSRAVQMVDYSAGATVDQTVASMAASMAVSMADW
jgi:hypothetical protein